MHEYGVFIGRFQPFHLAHLEAVRSALKQVKKLIIVVGSCNQPQTIKNPWSGVERYNMIKKALKDELSQEDNDRVEALMAEDYLYNNLMWVTSIQKSIDEVTNGSEDVRLVGHYKDESSFYLKLFPQWGQHIETGKNDFIDATRIREYMFRQDKITLKQNLPVSVYEYVCRFMETDEYRRLYEECEQVMEDKSQWEGSPYQPTFVTTDAIVICSGHVLVVRRRGRYGKGLIALPGGYIKPNELLVDGCIRELQEETCIKLDESKLKAYITDKAVFDHPNRDLRGRVITHAFCMKLPDGSLPKVKGNDDADKSWWMSIKDVQASENRFFSDHYHIINHFVTRY